MLLYCFICVYLFSVNSNLANIRQLFINSGWNFGPTSSKVSLKLGGRHCCTEYLPYEDIQAKLEADGTLLGVDGTISECAEGGEPKWIEQFTDNEAGTIDHYGHPYISCRPPRDIVGVKQAELTVAGQTIVLLDGLVKSRCFTETINTVDIKYYGTNGQLCAICPTPGANCVNGSKEEPLPPFSQEGFWRLSLNIRCEERDGDDGLEPCVKFANEVHSVRALGQEHPRAAAKQVTETKPRCPRERWDLSLRRQYPNLKEEESCYDFAGCRPKLACKGNNTCDAAYQYTMNMCQAWESGVDTKRYTVPTESDSGKGIGMYQCVTNSDCRTRSGDPERPNGADCEYTNPEDCAICLNTTNTTTGEVQGHCQCKPAERCALCTTYEYYQFNGECIACPENPGLIFIIFGIGIVGAIIGGKVLSAKRFNLAFISIGVDYFQVLALFAYSKIKWPPLLKQLMMYFSVFNFNADLTAPECLLPNLEYEHKWYAYMALPIVVTFILGIYIACAYSIKRFFMRQKKKKQTCSHASPIVGVQLILMYYLYMMLTRRIFYVFNCIETDPSDGYEYTEFTSITCEGGMCRCWNPGGVHLRLISFAIPAVFLYVIGFPLYILYIVKTYKNEIKEDQLLRAQNLGDSYAENPFAHHVRIRYHRIYYHFKPSKTYWFLYVIFRKFWIVMVGIILREQPGFQLSVTQLVLFLCFWLQQKHRPFMSTVERAAVVANHRAKAEEGVPLHRKIAERIKAVERSKSMNKHVSSLKTLDEIQEKKKIEKSLEYFWDYNTVEAVLLACSILICLAGVMFESDRFDDMPDGKPSKHAWQRDIVSYSTILLVFTSLVYYGTVFLSETGVLQVACLIKIFADKKKAIHRREEKRNFDDSDSTLVMSANPIMRPQNDDSAAMKEANDLLEEMAAAAVQLKMRLVNEKRKKINTQGTRGGKKKKNRKKLKKKNTAGLTNKMDDNEIELELVVLNTKPEKLKRSDSFTKHTTETGKVYYENEKGGTSWETPPENSQIIDEQGAVVQKKINKHVVTKNSIYNPELNNTEEIKEKKRKSFKRHKTKAGKFYYEDEKGETSWVTPPENSQITDGQEEVETKTHTEINDEKIDLLNKSTPDILPDDWDQHADGNGRKYFSRRSTGEVQWEHPAATEDDIFPDSSGKIYTNPLV